MLDGYREIRTERLHNGDFVLFVRAIEKGRFRASHKSFTKSSDSRYVFAEIESEIRGRPYDPDKPDDEQD